MSIIPAHDLPAGQRDELGRFRLTGPDVARVYGVSRQLVNYWVQDGRVGLDGARYRLGGIVQGKHRHFSPEVVDWFAEQVGLELNWRALPLELQRQLEVGWFDGRTPARTLQHLDERISEAEAARQLGLSKPALRKRRERGRLVPQLALEVRKAPAPDNGVTYSQQAVWRLNGVV